MTFVTIGLAIAGLISIAVPIIIHLLFRQRRKPIEWAAMRFLVEAFRKHRRRLRLEQWLLLAVRCAILLLLGAALARPILEAAGILEGDRSRAVLMVLDTGLASGIGESADDTALQRHVANAKDVIGGLGAGESVGVITAARPASSPVLPPSLDHAGVMRVLDSIVPSESPTDLPAALRIVRDAVSEYRQEGRSAVVYLFSEFRQGSASLEKPLPGLFRDAEDVILLAAPPATGTTTNVQVVAVEPVRRLILPGAADASQQVTVRLERHGGELGRAESRVRLIGDELPAVEPRMVQWVPGQAQASVSFNVPFARAEEGEMGLTAVIDDADSLDPDNRRAVAIDVRDRVRVAMVSPPTFERIGPIGELTPGQWIRRALRTSEESAIDIIDVAPASLSDLDLRTSDAVIVTRPDRLTDSGWSSLRGFIDRGGLAVFIPPAELNVHPWVDRFRTDLDLPWQIALEVRTHEEGLLLADEQPSSELMRLLEGELVDTTRSLRITRILPVEPGATRATTVLTLNDGSPMMIVGAPGGDGNGDGDGATEGRAGVAPASPTDQRSHPPQLDAPQDDSQGLVVYLAVAPQVEWTNLPFGTFMVPLFQETVRQGINIIRSRQQINVGEQSAIAGLPRAASTLRGPEGEVIDLDARRRPDRPLAKSGLYDVIDLGGQKVGRLAVNVDPLSGRTDVQSASAVAAWLGESGAWATFDPANPAANLAVAESGASIGGLLLFIVLGLVLLETILARRFSHAVRHGDRAELEGGLRPTLAEMRPAP